MSSLSSVPDVLRCQVPPFPSVVVIIDADTNLQGSLEKGSIGRGAADIRQGSLFVLRNRHICLPGGGQRGQIQPEHLDEGATHQNEIRRLVYPAAAIRSGVSFNMATFKDP